MNKYEEYKKSGILWMEELPVHWEIKPIKRYSYSKKELNKGNIEKNILSLTYKGVIKNNIDNPNGLVPKSYETYQKFYKNDLVFKLIDLENIKTSRVGLVQEDGIMSSAYIRLTLDDNFNPKYGYYYFYKLYIEQVFNNLGTGVRSTMSAKDLSNLDIPIPPLEEQNKIADYLDWKINEIDRLIAVEKEKIVDIDKYIQNKISDQYKDFDKRRLKTVLKEPLLYGINSSGSEMGKIRFIRITDIDKGGNLKNKNEQYIDECDNKYLLNKGDILLARSGATVGKAYLHINDENIMAFAGYLIRARVDQSIILPNYLYFYLLSNEYELWKENVFIQSTIQNISAEKYSNLRIPYVGKKKQIEIVSNVSKILRQTNNIMKSINETIDQLNSLKNSLISEVVTGRIDVRNVVIPSYEKVDIDISTDEEEIKE